MGIRCINKLIVIATERAELNEFMQSVRSGECELDFGTHIPEEESDDVYAWRVSNWGSTSNAYAVRLDVDELTVTYTFTTSNSPPTTWLDYVAQKFPNLFFRLRFLEVNMECAGDIIYSNGLEHNSEFYDKYYEKGYYGIAKDCLELTDQDIEEAALRKIKINSLGNWLFPIELIRKALGDRHAEQMKMFEISLTLTDPSWLADMSVPASTLSELIENTIGEQPFNKFIVDTYKKDGTLIEFVL